MSDEAPKVEPPPDTVPATRLAEVVAERNAARRELEAAKVAAGKATEWEATAAQTASELAAERAARAEERDLYRSGLVDEEAHVVARALYSALPKDARPATLGEYLGGLKAEGAAIPKALAGYLGGEPAKPGLTTTQPKLPASSGKATPTGAALTPEAYREAREHYARTGDLEPMRRLEAARKSAKSATA